MASLARGRARRLGRLLLVRPSLQRERCRDDPAGVRRINEWLSTTARGDTPGRPSDGPPDDGPNAGIECAQRLGGLLRFYHRAAA